MAIISCMVPEIWSVYSEAFKTIFLERGHCFFLYVVFPFQSYHIESTCTAVSMFSSKCTYAGEKYLRFPTTLGCYLCSIY